MPWSFIPVRLVLSQTLRRRFGKPLILVALLGSVLGTLDACRSDTERRLSEEALALSSLIHALRAAQNDAKAPALSALKKFQCQGARACEVQTVCVAGYAQQQEAMDAAELLRKNLASGDAVHEENAKGVLAFSEQNLTAAKQKIDQCVQLETALLVEMRP